jgi:hypothetical protein
MRANVVVLPDDDHDRAVKFLHSLDRTVWSGKVEAILESEKYDGGRVVFQAQVIRGGPWGVSVRKVVPTLTSKSAEIYPSMAGAK